MAVLRLIIRLKLSWLFDRQVSGFGALKNPVDVVSGTTGHIDPIRPVRKKAAFLCPSSPTAGQWKPVLEREFNDPFDVQHCLPRRDDIERVYACVIGGAKRRLEIVRAAHFNQVKLHTECLCSALGLPLFIIRMIRIPEERDPGDLRCSLPKKLKTLGRECVLQQRNAGRVAAGSTETRYETELFRIGAADEYERDCLIKSLCNRGDVPADRQDHIGLESD